MHRARVLLSLTILIPLALVTSSGSARAAFIDSNLAVSAGAQAGGGGCYPVSIAPGLLDMLTLIDPEWAAVDVGPLLPPFSPDVTVHGTIEFAKINEGGDFPADHVYDDQNTFITVDPADMSLVATGNVGPHGVEAGQMEVEREITAYPLFAWGGKGNRFTGVGRWIWDCGHPDPDPAGSCSTTASQSCVIDADCSPPTCPSCVPGESCTNVTFNYHSELHPPHSIAVSRLGQGYHFVKPVRGGRLATRTDVWISPDGGGAGDQCVLTHQASSINLLTVNCVPFSQQIANVNSSNFEFDIPLPPRPPGNTRPPVVRVLDQTPKGFRRPKVTTTFVDGPVPVVHAVVDMTTPIRGVLPSTVGKTIFAGWRRDPTPMTHLRVNVDAVEIVNALKPVTPAVPLKQRCSVTTSQDCSVNACPVGESCLSLGGPTPGWEIFLEVNGDWRKVAGLAGVAAPTVVPEKLSYDLALPATGTLNLHATGHSLGCLEAQLYDQSLQRDLMLYGLTDGATCLADGSHNPGALNLSFTGPDFGSGGSSLAHVTQTVGGAGGFCSATTTQPCLTSADCPIPETCDGSGGSYKLHYTIRKL
jgi:hypothetical protein